MPKVMPTYSAWPDCVVTDTQRYVTPHVGGAGGTWGPGRAESGGTGSTGGAGGAGGAGGTGGAGGDGAEGAAGGAVNAPEVGSYLMNDVEPRHPPRHKPSCIVLNDLL